MSELLPRVVKRNKACLEGLICWAYLAISFSSFLFFLGGGVLIIFPSLRPRGTSN